MPTRQQIIDDLASFSDLGTAPQVVEDVPTHLMVDWTYQGRSRRLEVREPGTRRCRVQVDDGPEASYLEFLASPVMGDLGRLATKTRLLRGVVRSDSARMVKEVGLVYPMDWYVDPRLSSSIGTGGAEGAALERLHEYADGESEDATRVLFVMAEAGQGKSSVLEEFTTQQAERYLRRETSHLALYIDAQGRGLARLDEVISRQLNELQFLLGYNALVTLVREGLVVLVIDGFDELIGSRGTFDDAFRSLTAFLEVLDGRGTIIAAGRSTYFVQEYEARGRMLSESLRYSLDQAFLKPWTRADQDQFVTQALESIRVGGQRKEQLRSAFSEFQDDEQLGELLRRPLFARDVLLVLLEGSRKPADLTADRLIPFLAHEYLRREVDEKLLTGDVRFLEPEQLEEFYRELAEQMWELETRELDVSDAEFIMDTWAEDSWHLEGEAREIARARAGKLPFLATGETGRRVRFEHEVFFGYFLASSLVSVLDGSQYALSLLSRGRLDPLTSDMVIQLTPSGDQPVLDGLAELASARHPRAVQIGVNAGALVAALLRLLSKSGGTSGLRVHDVALSGEDLSVVSVVECRFDNVTFDRVDLRGARILQSSSSGMRLEAVFIDPASTRLEIEGLDPARDVNGLQYEDQSGLLELTFDPDEVLELAANLGLSAAVAPQRFEVRPEVQERIERLCRAFRRVNSIGTNHDRFGVLFTDSLGTGVIGVLLDAGLVVVDTPKETRGGAQTFYRKRFDEAELMGALAAPPVTPGVDAAWKALAAL